MAAANHKDEKFSLAPVDDFPDNPEPYQQIIHAGRQESRWVWHPNAGADGEWWGAPYQIDSAFGGSAGGNTFFRLANATTGADRGILIESPIRILNISFRWVQQRVGNIQARLDGVSGGRDIPVNGNQVNFSPAIEDESWLIGSDDLNIEVLAFFWAGNDGVSRPFYKVSGVYVWRSN